MLSGSKGRDRDGQLIPGCLYVVATPLGNLEDITYRAVRILAAVDLIAAEDTRQTRKLLTYYQIKTPLCSYHAHNAARKGPELLARLKAGASLALVCDAGTPGISDPGLELVAQVWEAGLKVSPIPGPAAVTAALSIAGFPGEAVFVGFLPRRGARRREQLAKLAAEPRVLVLYEAPQRLVATLQELALLMPDRQVLVARELTKLFEDCRRGPLPEIAVALAREEIKGECTIVLSRPAVVARGETDLAGFLRAAAARGLSGRQAAQEAAAAFKVSRREAYQTYLALKEAGLLPQPPAKPGQNL